MNSLKIFSVFTGIGCPEISMTLAGIDFTSVGICEVDKSAIIAYSAIHNAPSRVEKVVSKTKEDMKNYLLGLNVAYNFSTGQNQLPRNYEDTEKLYKACIASKNFGDIRLVLPDCIEDFDLFTYSFPCKNISVAGKQDGLEEGSGTPSSLLWECDRIIEAKRPPFLLMENVRNLVSKKHLPDFIAWIRRLKELGYSSHWEILNAKDYGVPQNRERVIMVSRLSKVDPHKTLKEFFGKPQKLGVCLKDIMEDDNSVAPSLFYASHRPVMRTDKRPMKGKTDHLQMIGLIDGATFSRNRIYSYTGISPALNSMNGGERAPRIWTGRRVRRLSALETWRVMGIPDYMFRRAEAAGLKVGALYERAGRGIAVPILTNILEEVSCSISQR